MRAYALYFIFAAAIAATFWWFLTSSQDVNDAFFACSEEFSHSVGQTPEDLAAFDDCMLKRNAVLKVGVPADQKREANSYRPA